MCTWASCCNYVCGHGSKSLPLPLLYRPLRKRCDPKSFQEVKRKFYEAEKSVSNKPKKKKTHVRNFSVFYENFGHLEYESV